MPEEEPGVSENPEGNNMHIQLDVLLIIKNTLSKCRIA